MKHPPYHLRPNKAVDRFLVKEVAEIIFEIYPSETYTYYGFGGPFLEDFRLLGQFFPDLFMVSIEKDNDTRKRQIFHKPAKNVRLLLKDSKDFIAEYSAEEPGLFWLDNTTGRMSDFNDFMVLLGKAGVGSMIKVTLNADPRKLGQVEEGKREEAEAKFVQEYQDEYGEVLPGQVKYSDFEEANYSATLQSMLRIAAERVFPAQTGLTFQIVQSCSYRDTSNMLSVAGLICARNEIGRVKRAFEKTLFRNFDWHTPEKLDVPLLSTKERLKLERFLPLKNSNGSSLARALGYNVGRNRPTTLKMMKQYSNFYRYLPHYIKALP